MIVRPVLRATPFCNIHNIGLSASIRNFSSSPSTLLSRRIPSQVRSAQSQYAATPLKRHPLLLTTITATAFTATHFINRNTTYHDSSPDFSTSAFSHGRDAKVPLSKDGGRTINPKAIRQISMGSILGLGLGVLVSAFSKMLVLVLGVGIVVSQYAARRGFNVIPVDRVQRYVKGVNLRSAINDNAAFKISFGLMFALTAFGDF